MHYRYQSREAQPMTPKMTDIVPVRTQELSKDARPGVPAIIEAAGSNARYAYDEFFAGEENSHTERAYRHAVHRFLAHCDELGVPFQKVTPGLVSDYLKHLQAQVKTPAGSPAKSQPASKPTKKLHLAAIRKFFDKAVERHAVMLNPAASVRGPRHSVTEGKTPALDVKQARHLLASIDTADVVGLRDRAIIATLIYTAARVGAVSKLSRDDFYSDGRQYYFRLDEKGGKQRSIPARHDLQEYIEQYLAAADAAEGGSPLFRSAIRRTKTLSPKGMTENDVLRMAKRRLRDAGLSPKHFKCHSFRASTATNLLDQGVELADVQYLLGHSDPRTTKLYDRRKLSVTRNIVERIAI